MAHRIKTDWTGVPGTAERAEIVEYRPPKPGSKFIYVDKATIRRAIVTKAYFELDDVDRPVRIYQGRKTAIVRCLWYGCKPPTTWMHLTLLGSHRLVEGHQGDVAWNIGRRANG